MASQQYSALRRLTQRTRARLTRLEAERIDAVAAELAATSDDMRALIEFVRDEARRDAERSRRESQHTRDWADEFDAHIRAWVEEYFSTLRTHVTAHADEVAAHERQQLEHRLRRLERAVRAAPATAASPSAPPANRDREPTEVTLTPVSAGTASTFSYETFEDVLRGDSAMVTDLQQVYVARLAALPHPELPVIDVGCGRGELLGLLRDACQLAYGVDTSPTFVEDCREEGLEVVWGDAIEHLAGLPAGSVRAVTAFHVIEHLTLDQQLTLLSQCHRVLAPGGEIVLETPNPENLAVGSCSFWLDPTHLRPLPPALLAFVVGDAGFDHVETLRLHPGEPLAAPLGSEGLEPVAAWLSEILRGPMDYAVIGRRPEDA